MYITNIHHGLDETGNIAKEMTVAARKLFSFMALIIDETTRKHAHGKPGEELRCFKKGCRGNISGQISPDGTIDWQCSACVNEGKISEWRGTKWDNGVR